MIGLALARAGRGGVLGFACGLGLSSAAGAGALTALQRGLAGFAVVGAACFLASCLNQAARPADESPGVDR